MLQIHSINWKGGQYLLRFWNLSPMRLKFLCPIIGNYLYDVLSLEGEGMSMHLQ